MSFRPTKPTHKLKARVQGGGDDKRSAEVGFGWLSPETGALSLHLHPGVTLSWNDGLQLTVFPVGDDAAGFPVVPPKKRRGQQSEGLGPPPAPLTSDELRPPTWVGPGSPPEGLKVRGPPLRRTPEEPLCCDAHADCNAVDKEAIEAGVAMPLHPNMRRA